MKYIWSHTRPNILLCELLVLLLLLLLLYYYYYYYHHHHNTTTTTITSTTVTFTTTTTTTTTTAAAAAAAAAAAFQSYLSCIFGNRNAVCVEDITTNKFRKIFSNWQPHHVVQIDTRCRECLRLNPRKTLMVETIPACATSVDLNYLTKLSVPEFFKILFLLCAFVCV